MSNINPFQQFIQHTGTTFANESDGAWLMTDCDGDNLADLVFLKTANTPNNRVEVHIASGASGYRTRTLETPTTFACETDGVWTVADYDGDGRPDLIFIKTANTPNNRVEVHIASAASNYQTRILETPTTFACESDGTWLMADYDGDGRPDLIFIKTANTPNNHVEVHVASAASNYQSRIMETATTFVCETDGVWTMGDYNGDGLLDLIFIKTANTPGNMVEVHIASGASNYQNRVLETPSCFGCESDGTWLMADYEGAGILDLCFIKTSNTGTNSVEVHVAAGSTEANLEAVARRMAPIFRFHPQEQHFPCSVEWFLSRMSVVTGGADLDYSSHNINFQLPDGMAVKTPGPLDPPTLFAASHSAPTTGGEIDAISLFPLAAAPGANPSYSRHGYFTDYQLDTLAGEPRPSGVTPANCYTRVTNCGAYYLISYYFLCGYNGAIGGLSMSPDPMAPLTKGGGYYAHIGDWMRLSAQVTVSGRTISLLAVEFEAHGDTRTMTDAAHTFSNRPLRQLSPLIAYAAWHSHELYPSAGSWDLVSTTLAKDQAADGGLQWNTGAKLVVLNDKSRSPSQNWIFYNGLWGANINISQTITPEVDVEVVGIHIKTIPATTVAMQKNGPSGPAFKADWVRGTQYHSPTSIYS